jgi:hypothetical protein
MDLHPRKEQVMSGCGCGGAVAPSTAKEKKDCGCGCGGEAAARGTSFVRPSFFGGMLLTEDDLQAAVDYERAKRRLTNRYVLGDGVVCGLEADCHPCDPRKVTVQPGYAIDCCGDDIVVSCAEEIDVIDLARALRRKSGKDCGEPCDEQGSADYYLYLRYVETPSDPVAPYAQDDCSTGDCEYSRVREGYAFELRCEPPDEAVTMLDVLVRCLPEDEAFRADTLKLEQARGIAETYAAIEASVEAGTETIPDAPTKTEFETLAAGPVDLDAGESVLNRALAVLAFDEAAAKDLAPSPGLNADRRRIIREGVTALAARLRDSDALKEAREADAARLEHALVLAEKQPDLSGLDARERAWLAHGTTAEEADRTYVALASYVHKRVLDRLPGNCEERRQVEAMRIEGLSSASAGVANAVSKAYGEGVKACGCNAPNPPCPTCSDDAVALAKVHVEKCVVTDVCALERHWVQSPRALGYWVPVVETFRRSLEAVCCPSDDGKTRDPVGDVEDMLAALSGLFARTLRAGGTT